MRKLSLLDLALLGALVFQILLYSIAWVRFINDPTLYGTDFISFYTAGRIVRLGEPHNLYNLAVQQAIQQPIIGDRFAGGSNLSQHPPYLAPILALVAVDDFILAYILWTLVRLAGIAVCGLLIAHFLRKQGLDTRATIWITGFSLTFFPFFLSLLSGQDTVFVLIGLLLWMSGLIYQQERRAGAGLVLATLAPPIAGALALPLLASRRPASGWFLIFMALAGVYTLALVGIGGLRDFASLLTLSAGGAEYGLNPQWMYNLLGLILRTLPDISLEAARRISWLFTIISILLFCVLWWGKGTLVPQKYIGLAVIASTLTSPHLHIHGLSYLLLPALIVCASLWHSSYRLAVLLLPVSSLLLMFAAFFSSTASYVITYLLMATLAILLLRPEFSHLNRGERAA